MPGASRGRARVEDLAQETFLRVFRELPSWQFGGPRLSAWILTIATRLALDELRAAQRWTTVELPVVSDAIQRVHRDLLEGMRAIYIEATGDTVGAGVLSPRAMLHEIEDKALRGEPGRVRRTLAEEAAGLSSPPADPSTTSTVERALRLVAGVGGRFRHTLSTTVGSERAEELRAAQGGWPWARWASAGCPDC